MVGKVMGIVARNKEDGKVATMLHLGNVAFSDYDKSADVCEGMAVSSVYYAHKVDCKVGDIVNVEYGVGFGGKAIVEGITVRASK